MQITAPNFWKSAEHDESPFRSEKGQYISTCQIGGHPFNTFPGLQSETLIVFLFNTLKPSDAYKRQ